MAPKAILLTYPCPSIYANSLEEKKRLRKKRVEIPQDWLGTSNHLRLRLTCCLVSGLGKLTCNFFYFIFSWNHCAYRTINTSQNFAIKLHERIHSTFDFLFSDLDKFPWNKSTNNGIIRRPTYEFVWKGICRCTAQSFFIQISNLYMCLQTYF